MKVNNLKKILASKDVAIGTMVTEFKTPEVIRIMDAAGFDYVFIDTEHSSFYRMEVVELVRASKSLDITSLVRVPEWDYHLIAGILDSGAEGIMIPRVETRKQVKSIVAASKYPPKGIRGYGPRGIITDYQTKSVAEWIEKINEESMVILQIERKNAIEDIEGLLSIQGVDGALIGPQDLSISLGIPGDHRHPKFIKAVQKVVDACENYGLTSGIHTRRMDDLLFWKKKGMRLLTYSTDVGLVLSASQASIREIKERS